MAILLGGLFILGLETGVDMVTTDVDIVFVMIFTVIFGNFIGTIFGMFLVNPIARATSIRSSIMVPILIAVVVTGAFAAQGSLFDIVVTLIFGVIGYLMKILNYSRAAMLIGYVLGHAVEKNLYLATQLKGTLFFLSPIPLTLCLITLGFIAYNVYGMIKDRERL
jgi:TctA family transporter